MATSKPSLISSRPPLPLTDIASQVWAESTREPVPLSKIPTHTHESGVAVTIFARQKERWPDVTLTPASKLVSRVFEKYDDRTGEYRLATLAETLPYLLDSLPPWLARYRLSCMPGNEADVMLAANSVSYHNLHTIAQYLLRTDNDMIVEFHSGLTSQKELDPERVVIGDEALVLKHMKGRDVKERSEWLNAEELRLEDLSPELKKNVKSILLMVEFKRLNTNVTAKTAPVEEWSLVLNPEKEGCFVPAGQKAPTVFAQAVVYAKNHRANSFLVDDWTAPKSLRFRFRRDHARNMKTSDRLRKIPIEAELSHLAVASGGQKEPGDVTPQAAALFLLAEQMVISGSSWLDKRIPRNSALTSLNVSSDLATIPPEAKQDRALDNKSAISAVRSYTLAFQRSEGSSRKRKAMDMDDTAVLDEQAAVKSPRLDNQ